MVRGVLVLTAAAVGLSGCGGFAKVRSNVANVGSKVPFVYREPSPDAAYPAYVRNPREQYFDKLHHRYYYYDPGRKAYFWENGQPKG